MPSQRPPSSGKPSPFRLPVQNAGSKPAAGPVEESPFKVDGMTALKPQPASKTAAAAARKLKSRPIGLVTIGPEPVEMPMPRAMTYSAVLHVAGPFVTGLLILLLALLLSWLLNFNLWDLFKKEEKPDMVFTLVQDTNAKRPDQATMRGQFNQVAGGENDPDKPLTPEEKQASAPAQQSTPQQAKKPVPPQPQQQPRAAKTPPQPKQPPQPKLKPLIATKSAPTPKAAQKAPDGPVVKSAEASTHQSPQPSQLPSMASAATQRSVGSGLTPANSEGGSGRSGVNVQSDLDFGPYMAYLQRTMKRNWAPPKSAGSKRVVIRFVIAKDGRLLSKQITQTSGDELMDQSALNAVDLSAPFRPLPTGFTEASQPIDFTFDHTIFRAR